MPSSRSSSISFEEVGEEWSPTNKRLNARPVLMYGSDIGAFDSEREFMGYIDGIDSDDDGPADEFKPNQKLSLMTLPREIRDRIFSLVAEPEFWIDECGALRLDSGTTHLRRIPIEIRSTVLSIFYRRRYLIIDLPDFEPCLLESKFHNGIKQHTWPSEIHFHDQWDDFAFRTVPTFLTNCYRRATRFKCIGWRDIQSLPLHLFEEIVIKIPPPSKSGDIAQFIMNWNRLRFLARLLTEAFEIDRKDDFIRLTYGSKGLPPVKIIFLDDDERSGTSWFDENARLKTSITLPTELMVGEDRDHSSDLLLLLRALAPIRGSSKFSVEPTLPDSFQDLDFSLTWMSRNSTQIRRFGECVDTQWNDLLSFHWLTRFEIYLHGLLHNLDTPIAPFLRLEQMATASHIKHVDITRYAARYKQTSNICSGADDLMTAIGSCAFVFAPEEGQSLCRCGTFAERQTTVGGGAHTCSVLRLGEYSPLVCQSQAWRNCFDATYQQWEDEFVSVRRRLLHVNGHALTDDGRISTESLQHLNPPVSIEQIFGFMHYYEGRPTTAFDVNRLYDHCTCFIPMVPIKKKGKRRLGKSWREDPEAWISAWPHGIIHDKQVIRSCSATHHCRNIQENSTMYGRYLCLDRSRRDKDGICNGAKQNTSAPFLVQFAHLTMRKTND